MSGLGAIAGIASSIRTILMLGSLLVGLGGSLFGGCTKKKNDTLRAEKIILSSDLEHANTRLNELEGKCNEKVDEAARKCGEGVKLDAMEKDYKLTAKTCQKILRQRALDLVKQEQKVVK